MTLADTAHARTDDPITSHEAAGKVTVREKQMLVLRAVMRLAECGVEGPYTAEAINPIADQLNKFAHPKAHPLGGSTVRSRIKELCDTTPALMQLVDRAGATTSGCRCARYQITDEGIAYVNGDQQ